MVRLIPFREEGSIQLFVRGTAVSIAAIAAFIASFFMQGSPGDAYRASIAFGLLSAIAWGLGSIGGPKGLSNGSNVFAALFTAAAIGFAVNTNPACNDGAFQRLCEVRRNLMHVEMVPQPQLPAPAPPLQLAAPPKVMQNKD